LGLLGLRFGVHGMRLRVRVIEDKNNKMESSTRQSQDKRQDGRKTRLLLDKPKHMTNKANHKTNHKTIPKAREDNHKTSI
jgi:hypothetical protein